MVHLKAVLDAKTLSELSSLRQVHDIQVGLSQTGYAMSRNVTVGR